MTDLVLGVDPGGSGALAVIDRATLDLVAVVDMPQHGGIVSAPLVADLVHLVDSGPHVIPERHLAEAWVEQVHSMPKQGVASSFKFGQAYGTVLGVLGGARIPTNLVTPRKWKGHYGLSADKGASRRRAIELWPSWSASFARVKDDGRAEAALIARYGIEAGR